MSQINHLARRFFGSLRTHWPEPSEQRLVASLLESDESKVFWRQPVADIAHALAGIRHLAEQAHSDRSTSRAFLLHDIGKRHARLGTIGRSIATVLGFLRLPRTRRHTAYLEHGASGADELEKLGCESLVVEFARLHHGSRPPAIDSHTWSALVAADRS